MIATILNPKTKMNRLSRKIRWNQPLRVKASEIDGYGNYGCQMANELKVAIPQLGTANPIIDISAEEFEAAYRWFYS